jgi:hypothetical protein
MFKGLQKKWQVKGWQVLLILIIFTLGGSLTGFAGRKLMLFLKLKSCLFISLYIFFLLPSSGPWPFYSLAFRLDSSLFLKNILHV